MKNGAQIMLLHRDSWCIYVLDLCCIYVHFKWAHMLSIHESLHSGPSTKNKQTNKQKNKTKSDPKEVVWSRLWPCPHPCHLYLHHQDLQGRREQQDCQSCAPGWVWAALRFELDCQTVTILLGISDFIKFLCLHLRPPVFLKHPCW